MKKLPAFRNYDICNFMMDLTQDCVEAYKTDVAHDVKCLYKLVLMGNNEVYWGVRKCGTGMGYEDSEILEYYKAWNMISLFKFTNLRVVNGDIRGDIEMVSYKEPYKNNWYNDLGKDENWYRAGDDFDVFYHDVRKISREIIENSND